MLIEYDGTDFWGWQYQSNNITIQGEIEYAIKKITQEETRIIGAGRTDRGVHALGQVANFWTDTYLELDQIHKGLNSLTGKDIYIKSVVNVDEKFHSRYSAKSKVYNYHIIRKPSPLRFRYNWVVQHKLDVFKMKEVMPYLLNEHDFKNFSVTNGNDNTICRILSINLTEDNCYIIIHIEANRFLRKMIRGIVGFIYDVGRRRCSPSNIQDVFNGVHRNIFFAPPNGLCLVEVKY